MKRITVHLPAVLMDWLECRAEECGFYPGQLIAHLLARDLEKHFAPRVGEALDEVEEDLGAGPVEDSIDDVEDAVEGAVESPSRQAWLFPDPAPSANENNR